MRCFGDEDPLYAKYHDEEWGVFVQDENVLFEMLILEGQQAGLSWLLILKRRPLYRAAFHGFNPKKVALMSDGELETVLTESGVIKNRRKVWAARQNARIFLKIQEECGSFHNYLKRFVPQIVIGRWKKKEDVPCSSEESKALSKDLKKRGMTFVGPLIIYSFMQAVGLVNDHLESCKK